MGASQETIVPVEGASTDVVRAVTTRPGRMVLTVDGMPDAWMASDLCVEIRP